MDQTNNEFSLAQRLLRRALSPVVILACVLWALPQDAHAYIDPGSGALLIQAALSGIFGFIFIARKTLARIASRLLGKEQPGSAAGSDGPPSPPKND